MNDKGMENGKTALVTGASRGIGQAIAEQLAADGYRVILAARSESDLVRVAERIRSRGGIADVASCDVTDPGSIRNMLESAALRHGAIDVLVNCAGRGGGGRTAEVDEQLWREVINTNLNSVYYVTKTVLSEGRMGEKGAIINIASTGGKQGVVYAAAYSASKHGVVGFTKSLALELAKQGITVNAVCPGFVETGLAQRVRQAYASLWGTTPAEAKARIEQRIPIGRYIEPGEVASMVSYLASPAARGITGQAINVCGGLGNY